MNDLETKICKILHTRLGCQCEHNREPDYPCETVKLIIGVLNGK